MSIPLILSVPEALLLPFFPTQSSSSADIAHTFLRRVQPPLLLSSTCTSVSSPVLLSALFFPQTTQEMKIHIYGSIFSICVAAEKKICVDCADLSPSFLLTETLLQAIHPLSSNNSNSTLKNNPLSKCILAHNPYNSTTTPMCLLFFPSFVLCVYQMLFLLTQCTAIFVFEISSDFGSTPDEWMPFY